MPELEPKLELKLEPECWSSVYARWLGKSFEFITITFSAIAYTCVFGLMDERFARVLF